MSGGIKKAKRYNNIRIRLKLVDLFFIVFFLLSFQIFVSNPLKEFTYSITANFYCSLIIYLVMFSITYYIISFPLSIYSSFLLEKKFSLSSQSLSNWLKDDIKGSFLSLFVFIIFVLALYFFLRNFTTTWWIWIAIFWFIATVLIAKITPVLILPLFFKYLPVDDKLKERILALSRKCGIKIINVYKIDFSKKTKKLNAAVIGMGSTRRVVLADNLVNDFTDEEIEGVLAHEFAHHKLKHMWKMIVFGILANFLSFYLLFVVSIKLAGYFGVAIVSDVAIFPAFILVLFFAGFFILPVQNGFSRKLEKEADLFALKITKNKIVFISLMEKLAAKNLADPNPPKLIKFIFYSHPPIKERIEMAKDFLID